MNFNSQKPKLIYIGDPMCSWCYGIAEELDQTIKHFEGQVELELIMGGLRAGGGEEWNQQFKDFLKHHWEDVSDKSGQPFKFELLENAHFNYDTEPACRSVISVYHIESKKAFTFFKEVQKGFYFENRDPKEVDFYKSICAKLDLDFSEFSKLFESEEIKEATQQHFRNSETLGVRSFPTVLLEQEGKIHLIASGYSTHETMKQKIEGIIK